MVSAGSISASVKPLFLNCKINLLHRYTPERLQYYYFNIKIIFSTVQINNAKKKAALQLILNNLGRRFGDLLQL